MIEREKIEKFYSCISGAKKVVLFGHVNPDGDSIGSLSGMYDFLANNGIEAERIVPGAYPGFLAFLDPEKKITVYNDEKEKALSAVKEADLMVCLDFNSFSRIDEIGEAASRSAAVKILIDHHLFPDKSFDLTISDTEVSSTCELVYIVIEELLKLYPAAPLSLAGETALYTGIMTDTNNFANSVRPDTFRIASLLMEHGVDKTAVQQSVFGGFSEERMRLMGYMLYENMRVVPELKASVMVLDKATKERFGFKTGDSEGFVNLGLNIAGVDVAALFTEDDNFLRVSLRSKGDFSVNSLAKEFFNGGGHKNASGGRVYMPVSEIAEYYFDAVRKYRHTI